MMTHLELHDFHKRQQASFAVLGDMELVDHYADVEEEYKALTQTVGLLDLGFRGRLCLTGADRLRFLHGQVTNEVSRLQPGQGCYAALVTAKGKMESDLHIFCLEQELLLDFEPGLTQQVTERLERYIIADDVQVADAGPHYGLLSLQGPRADRVWERVNPGMKVPEDPWRFVTGQHKDWGEVYGMRVPRGPGPIPGIDFYVPVAALEAAAETLTAAVSEENGRLCGWLALEITRVESGRPRFGLDMDASNLASETGIEKEAIRYDKGCYIGQEVIARIRTYGRVNKMLRGLKLKLDGEWKNLPAPGTKLFDATEGKEAGYLTSVVQSPRLGETVGLGYVRKAFDQTGTELVLKGESGDGLARIVDLPLIQ
jgi:folate-binding protein YgfZ